MSHAVIVCEGYQDRQFISAWLDRRGMRKADKQAIPFRDTYEKVNDAGLRISIVAAMGKEKVLPMLEKFMNLNTTPVAAWLVVTDTDGVEPAAAEASLRQSLEARFAAGPRVEIAQWHPILEGMIERALRTAHPNRMTHVSQFLATRPEAPATTGKEATRVYSVSWRTQYFGEAFFADVLRDDQLRPLIEAEVPQFAARIDHLLSLR